MEQPSQESITRYASRNAAAARKVLRAVHPHHPPETVREAEYKGHRIVIGTTYRIEVDGKPVGGHFIVTDAGEVQCHAMPNYTFASAVDLVKSMIDVFPDDFPEGGPGGESGHGHGATTPPRQTTAARARKSAATGKAVRSSKGRRRHGGH